MTPNLPHRMRSAPHARQRGVVLFIALIAMVVLTLGGIALVRSVDTGTAVAGNIAFRQASIVAVNWAVESSVDALYKSKTIANTNANDTAHHYYAALQGGELSNGTPAMLAGAWPPAGYALTVQTDPATNAEIRHVIERVCNDVGTPGIATCDMLPPKVSNAGTDNECQQGPGGVYGAMNGSRPGGCIPLPPIPNFRVTVRVDLPNTNTTTIAQTFLR
jgi:type IV pilus assembly protein PilX